jgi:predicted metal-dependent hydrolase
MSRSWNDDRTTYLNTLGLWSKIDALSAELDQLAEASPGNTSENYKMFLMGRREMLDLISSYLHEHEETLAEIAKYWGLVERKD